MKTDLKGMKLKFQVIFVGPLRKELLLLVNCSLKEKKRKT